MARAGETPTPAVQTGADLPYGSATQVAALSQVQPPAPFEDEIAGLAQDQGPEQDLSPQDQTEQFLFSPTDRPNEPLTAGAPFGEGPGFTRHAYETDRDFLSRVASTLAASPDASQQVKAFLARVSRGE